MFRKFITSNFCRFWMTGFENLVFYILIGWIIVEFLIIEFSCFGGTARSCFIIDGFSGRWWNILFCSWIFPCGSGCCILCFLSSEFWYFSDEAFQRFAVCLSWYVFFCIAFLALSYFWTFEILFPAPVTSRYHWQFHSAFQTATRHLVKMWNLWTQRCEFYELIAIPAVARLRSHVF